MSYDTTKPYTAKIFDLMRSTWRTPYIDVQEGIYPTFTKKISYPEVDHTDGIGTKGAYHWQKRTFQNAVYDALAMNLNDLALAGATPYKLQNHIILPLDDEEAVLEIIETLIKECKARQIALTGGETSIQNNVAGLDISMTVSGFIEKPFNNQIRAGDALIGIASNGLHSNGFTKVRKIFAEEFRDDFIAPTRVYLDEVSTVKDSIHGMMHITGGAFTKLKKVLTDSDIHIRQTGSLKPHQIFYDIYERGVSDEEMYKTFNCGVGFVLGVAAGSARKIASRLSNASVIGEVVAGHGSVHIQSAFSGKTIIF